MEILLGVAVAFGLLSLVLFRFALGAIRKKRWMKTAGRTGGGALFLSLSALAATLGVSTQGYRGLTSEQVALTVTTVPSGPQSFQAFVEFPDGRDTTFAVEGDQIMIDAHILKWRYFTNVIGFRTQYELDRLSGRYIDIADQRRRDPSVHSLKSVKPVDLFDLASRYSFLAFLVDAEYGSATYIEVQRPARFEVTVSTTGLLVREVVPPADTR